MKTAVEWLIDMLITENEITLKGENYKLFEQAKAMEEQNQLDLIRFLRTQDKMGKSVEDLYKQFKSEQNESI